MSERPDRWAILEAAPERMVWSRHRAQPGVCFENNSGDARVFDVLSEWVPNADRYRILVENPETFYGFEKGARQ
jgi:predicted TIM-barrel fold metal-dependent hydrolase